jgi:3-deoxy-manno-octulosonate cytidylyltransferase (CMP-KDO synthetase)
MSDGGTVVLIPARMSSSRFPGKPLVTILGLPMIEHVRRRALLCPGVSDVIVTTCDEEIRKVVEQNGGRALMTASTHERCTDRIEEAAAHVSCDIVVNVQGDEPTLLPEIIDQVAEPLRRDRQLQTTCIVYPVLNDAELDNQNFVKVVLSATGKILYFSRAPIPSRARGGGKCFKQSGIMAFRETLLHEYSRMPPTPLEAIESVDMLRLLEHDRRIQAVVSQDETIGVDMPSDVSRAEEIIRSDPRQWSLYERIRG